MAQGWISLHRKIMDCDLLWADKPFSRGQAWIDLLLLANHEDKKTIFEGNPVLVKKGQRLTSKRVLGERWGWSITKVTKFLQVLESEQMLIAKSDTKKTLITIVKYGIYQDSNPSEVTEKEHQNDTEITLKENRNKTEINQKENRNKTEIKQKETNNNDNNENNENNDNNENKKKRTKNAVALFATLEKSINNSQLSEPLKIKMLEFLKYRKEIKHPFNSEIGFNKLLDQAFQQEQTKGTAHCIAVIDTSMVNNWQGLFWDKSTNNYRQQPKNDMASVISELKARYEQ